MNSIRQSAAGRRAVAGVAVLCIATVAFVAGYAAGRGAAAAGAGGIAGSSVGAAGPDGTRSEHGPAHGGVALQPMPGAVAGGPGLAPVPDAAALDDLLARWEARVLARDWAAAQPLRDAIVRALRQRSAIGAGRDALAALAGMLRLDPGDADLLLLESDLWQQQGDWQRALEPLLTVLGMQELPVAREALRRLISAQEGQLASRRDHAALVRLFEQLVARDPFWDGHRLRLAHWLLVAGQRDAAEAVLREAGSVGVDEAARDDLVAAIELARTGLPLEQGEHGLYARLSLGDRSARLLVDTGATTTVLSPRLAEAAKAELVQSGIDVRTAGGVVQGSLHRVRDVRLGGLAIDELEVLVLPHLPDNAEGLVGMDVLGRIPAGMLPATLLGTPAGSG